MRHLDLADLDESRGYLTITPKKGWTTKSYRYRSVPVSSTTITALKTFIATRHLVPLDDKSVWKIIQNLRTRAGVATTSSMHDLRRAWASAVHDKEASLKKISVWLGHSGMQVTERYLRITSDHGGHEFLPR